MEQIYTNIAELIIDNLDLRLHRVDNPKTLNLVLQQRFYELTTQERAFVCTMIAFSVQGANRKLRWQLEFKMNAKMYASHKTYHKVRKQLLAKNVIRKVDGRNRFYLNPEYHPSLSDDWQQQAEDLVNIGILRIYQQQFGERAPEDHQTSQAQQ